MDTRGYGRTAGATARERRTTGTLMLLGLCAICVGVYGALDRTTPAWVGTPMLALGAVVSLVAVRGAGRRVGRSRYRPAPWLWPEGVVAASGITVALAVWWMSHHQLAIAYPGLTVAPTLSLTALAAAGVALGGALCAPHPAQPRGGAA
jgi:energy-coupling factor transport system permease protein